CIVPENLVGIVGILHWFIRLEHPGWNGAEVDDCRVAFSGREKILRYGVNVCEVPRSVVLCRRLQFSHRDLWVGKPGDIANIICSESLERSKGTIVNWRATIQHWIGNHLERRRRLRNDNRLAPI